MTMEFSAHSQDTQGCNLTKTKDKCFEQQELIKLSNKKELPMRGRKIKKSLFGSGCIKA